VSSEKVTPEEDEGVDAWEDSPAGQVSTLILAILIALAIRAFVIEPFTIPSGSMFPTLLIGDHLFVNKFLYGAKVPFLDWRLPSFRAPKRGDVVVFDVGRGSRGEICPVDRCPKYRREAFIKRVVGLPGDTVTVRNARLVINGEVVPAEDTGESFVDPSGQRMEVFRERLGDRDHLALDHPLRNGKELTAFKVEPGRYLMMGDNRDSSNDGRYFGTIRLAEMKGPAFIIYWSWNYGGGWLELVNPLTWWELLRHETRWGRMGMPIS